MTWTTEKPTAAGWYWMRAPKCGWRDCVVWVDKDEDGFYIDVGDCDSDNVMDIEAEWLGPITPDSYQQGRVTGLREAKENLERLEYRDTRLQTDVEDFYAWIDDQLAQQAQEGGVGDAKV